MGVSLIRDYIVTSGHGSKLWIFQQIVFLLIFIIRKKLCRVSDLFLEFLGLCGK